MELSSTVGLASVFLLVLANGFFVATEFAIVAIRRSRLEQLVQEGHTGAVAAKNVVAHLDTYIAATQFGITLASNREGVILFTVLGVPQILRVSASGGTPEVVLHADPGQTDLHEPFFLPDERRFLYLAISS